MAVTNHVPTTVTNVRLGSNDSEPSCAEMEKSAHYLLLLEPTTNPI